MLHCWFTRMLTDQSFVPYCVCERVMVQGQSEVGRLVPRETDNLISYIPVNGCDNIYATHFLGRVLCAMLQEY